jgi:hypothetical protein
MPNRAHLALGVPGATHESKYSRYHLVMAAYADEVIRDSISASPQFRDVPFRENKQREINEIRNSPTST